MGGADVGKEKVTQENSVTFSDIIAQLQLHTPILRRYKPSQQVIQSLYLSLKSHFLKASEKTSFCFLNWNGAKQKQLSSSDEVFTRLKKHEVLRVNIGLNYLLKWTFSQCAPRPGSKLYLKSWKTRACQTNSFLNQALTNK